MVDQYFFYGMTINPTNGKTYWQSGGFDSPDEVVAYVKRYTKTPKHLAIYRRNYTKAPSHLEFVKHLNVGTY